MNPLCPHLVYSRNIRVIQYQETQLLIYWIYPTCDQAMDAEKAFVKTQQSVLQKILGEIKAL
jgi:hypothetical protein